MRKLFISAALVFTSHLFSQAQTNNVDLANVRMRDVCILADEATKTYYAVSSTMAATVDGGRRPALRVYTSKDLRVWEGPHIVFQTPENFWGDIKIKAIWAPELHFYKGKYYVFATFDTDSLLSEQWRNCAGETRHSSAG
jgi:arabinan endo-1,5-alpha-L-arabinosidase